MKIARARRDRNDNGASDRRDAWRAGSIARCRCPQSGRTTAATSRAVALSAASRAKSCGSEASVAELEGFGRLEKLRHLAGEKLAVGNRDRLVRQTELFYRGASGEVRLLQVDPQQVGAER